MSSISNHHSSREAHFETGADKGQPELQLPLDGSYLQRSTYVESPRHPPETLRHIQRAHPKSTPLSSLYDEALIPQTPLNFASFIYCCLLPSNLSHTAFQLTRPSTS